MDSRVYSILTTEIAGQRIEPPYADRYEIQLVMEDEMILLHEKMGKQFESRRVSCD